MMYNMSEKEIIDDTLFSEKVCGSEYYRFATECSNKNLCSDLIEMSKESAQFCHKLTCLMANRSWTSTEEADSAELNKLRREFSF